MYPNPHRSLRARTTEGRIRAVTAGVRMGLSPTQRAHALAMREAGKSLQAIGDVLGVSHDGLENTDRVSRALGFPLIVVCEESPFQAGSDFGGEKSAMRMRHNNILSHLIRRRKL
jgi:hypothetical protein